MRPKVACMILVWNNVEDTRQCVQSLEAATYANRTIVMIDNGSREETVSALRKAFPDIEVLELGTNLGFSGGNNVGLDYALRRDFDYVFLLNQDTTVAPEAIEVLVEFAESHPNAGIVGPTVLCSPDDSVLYARGGVIEWARGNTRNEGMFEPAGSVQERLTPQLVDFVPGCGMLVSNRFLKEVGPLDPAFFLNFEEVEWAVRGRRLGFECWCVPAAQMRHKISASLGMSSPANTYYMTRNALRFFWFNGTGLRRWSAVAWILFSTLRTVAAWSLRRRYRSPQYRSRSLANVMAVRDFFRRRYGKMDASVARICGFVH